MRIILYNSLIPLFVELGEIAFYPHKLTVGASVAAWVAKFDDKPILAKVYKGMTWLEEMESFVLQNGISKDPTTNEKLRAQYNSKNPYVCNMVDCAERAGFLVDFGTGQRRNRISATSALFKSYMTLGAVGHLRFVEHIRVKCFHDPSNAVLVKVALVRSVDINHAWANLLVFKLMPVWNFHLILSFTSIMLSMMVWMVSEITGAFHSVTSSG